MNKQTHLNALVGQALDLVMMATQKLGQNVGSWSLTRLTTLMQYGAATLLGQSLHLSPVSQSRQVTIQWLEAKAPGQVCQTFLMKASTPGLTDLCWITQIGTMDSQTTEMEINTASSCEDKTASGTISSAKDLNPIFVRRLQDNCCMNLNQLILPH